jgi:hypothetical protein
MGRNRIILDSGALSAFATETGRLRVILRKAIGAGLAVCVPAPVLTESITGSGPRDARVNQVLKACVVLPLDEAVARVAGALRYRRPGSGPVGAMVVACADAVSYSVIITGDGADLGALVNERRRSILVELNRL